MKVLADRLGVIRFFTWWNYKLPPLFGIAFLFALYSHLTIADSLWRLVVLLISMIGTAGFGHYLNDWFDIESDRISGKENSALHHSSATGIFILLTLALASLLPWLLFFENGTLHLLIIAMLLLFVLYSVPPVRLKNRAFSGILADTLYAHAIPALVVMFAILEGFQYDNSTLNYMLIVFVWQFFAGFRNIAFHQYEDYTQDKESRLNTWAVKIGAGNLKKLCLFAIHPAEVIAFLIFAGAIFSISMFAGILLLVLIAVRFYVYRFIYDKNYLTNWRNYFSFVNNSYEEDLPIAMLIALCFMNPAFVFLLILFCILFPEFFKRMQQV